jgi:transketolase
MPGHSDRGGSEVEIAIGAAGRLAAEHRWIGERDVLIGMAGFGASAPAVQLYEHVGVTAERVARAARGPAHPDGTRPELVERTTTRDN